MARLLRLEVAGRPPAEMRLKMTEVRPKTAFWMQNRRTSVIYSSKSGGGVIGGGIKWRRCKVAEVGWLM